MPRGLVYRTSKNPPILLRLDELIYFLDAKKKINYACKYAKHNYYKYSYKFSVYNIIIMYVPAISLANFNWSKVIVSFLK
jgi:hypothetical protein